EGRCVLPCSASRDQTMEFFAELARARPGGTTTVGSDLLGIVQAVSRRGLAVVVSDFFTADDSAFELLRQLHAHRQETVVFQVLSPDELELPEEGQWLLEDAETGEERVVDLDAARRGYRERLEAFCARVRSECEGHEFDHVRLSTGEPVDRALRAYLERRTLL
ncbi:MAG: hypothetical protein ACKPGK_05495, partial [Verrucomicrobiota bacterium]